MSPKFTKKQYEAIADVLGHQIWKCQIDGQSTSEVNLVVCAFMDYFERNNPGFKPNVFFKRVQSWNTKK